MESTTYRLVGVMKNGSTSNLVLDEGTTEQQALTKFREYAASVGNSLDKLMLLKNEVQTSTVCEISISTELDSPLPINIKISDETKSVASVNDALKFIG